MKRKAIRWAAWTLMAFALLSVSAGATEALSSKRPVVVDITAAWPETSPEDVERQVTIPLEVACAGIPGLQRTCSQTLSGLAWLRLEFPARTSAARARQDVIQRLQSTPFLPAGVTPQMSTAPLANQILRYTLRSPKDSQGKDVYTASNLRALQEWVLRRNLVRIPGVADVIGVGGADKRYEVQPDPERLTRYGIRLEQLQIAIAEANAHTGGDYLRQGRTALTVRAVGLFGGGADPVQQVLTFKEPLQAAVKLRAEEQRRIREIRSLVIASVQKAPVCVEDVVDGGRLSPGEELGRRGVVVGDQPRVGQVSLSRQGAPDEEDLIQGMVLVRDGEDPQRTLRAVQQKIRDINENPGLLLPGVRVEPFYERASDSEADQEVLWGRGVLPVNISLAQAREQMRAVRALLLGYPQVRQVVSQIGMAEGSSEPVGFDLGQVVVLLRPAKDWPGAAGRGDKRVRRELADTLTAELARKLAGAAWDMTPDFSDDMQAAFTAGPGVRVLKILGPDLEALEQLATKAAQQLKACEGVGGVQMPHCLGRMCLDLHVDHEKCKRHGIAVANVNRIVEAARGGIRATQMIEGEKTFDIRIVWPDSHRSNEAAILDLPVEAPPAPPAQVGNPANARNVISTSARLRVRDLVSALGEDGKPDPKAGFLRRGAAAIYRENGQRLLPIHFHLRDKDAAEILATLREKLAPLFKVPYRALWEAGS